MKPKIKTRLANLFAKLAGSDDYDPNVKPITPLEFYLEKYSSESIPVITVPKEVFTEGASCTVENAENIVKRIFAYHYLILKYQDTAEREKAFGFICETSTSTVSRRLTIYVSHYSPAHGVVPEKSYRGSMSYAYGTNKLTFVLINN